MTGFEDWLPALLQLTGAKDATRKGIDGISFVPTLFGGEQPERPFLYRESPGYGGQQSVRVGDWKAIRTNLNPPAKAKKAKPSAIELYDLSKDPNETTDVAAAHPDVVARLAAIMKREHVKRVTGSFPSARSTERGRMSIDRQSKPEAQASGTWFSRSLARRASMRASRYRSTSPVLMARACGSISRRR